MLVFTLLNAILALFLYVIRHILRYSVRSRKLRTSLRTKVGLKSFNAASTDNKYPRLSRFPSLIKPEYDIVVIGSGYGAGVAASRMARAGKSVCVLERGAERWPGEYPHTFREALQNYRVSGRLFGGNFSIGRLSALYHTVICDGQDVFLGCGLGGTSLINAGVFLRPEDRLLEAMEWPVQIRESVEELEKYYSRAEHMLQPRPFPSTYATPRKLATFEDQARSLGVYDSYSRPPLTTSFQDGINSAGVHVHECTGSGNECTGTNDGSKNSVLVTYLADAWARGAELFCGVDVRYVMKRGRGNGYMVCYEMTSAGGEKMEKWVVARDLVILGAGALGTTEILLRSQTHGLPTSPLLGQRLSGNGDTLSFAYNCKQSLHSVGHETLHPTSPKLSCGPTIAGCIDMRSSALTSNVRDGYVIQEGTIPEALAPVIQFLLETRTLFVRSKSHDRMRGMAARVKGWILGPYAKGGSVNRTLVFLTMSHDEKQGALVMKDDAAVVRWSGPGSRKRSAKVDNFLSRITDALGGILIKAPCLTVHPLGGAVISGDETGLGGVVDHRGQLFTGRGAKVHGGIFCLDGSIIPTSLGVNPCATITALAERSCDLIIQERGWEIDEAPNGILDLFGSPKLPTATVTSKRPARINSGNEVEGVQFEETMLGHIYIGNDISDFKTAEKVANAAACSAQLTVTVDARRAKNGSYLGFPGGIFACHALSLDPLLITNGAVEFFKTDEDVADATSLVYDLDLLSTNGTKYAFHGYKRLDSAVAFSVSRTWSATTTLFTTITGSDGLVIGRGILHLPLCNFISELWSLRSCTKVSTWSNLYSQARFLDFFVKNIASYYLSPFRSLQYPTSFADTTGYYTKAIPSTVSLTSDDGQHFPIKIWHPAPGTFEKYTPLMFIPGASVDDQIFSLPTIPTNTIDYFTSLGYRCYVPVLRFGIGEAARNSDTVYNARLDVRAAMKYVREREGKREIYVVAHCLGSIAMGIALLCGDVEARWIKGMTCSQVFINLIFSSDNALKARSGLVKVYEMLARSEWFSCHSTPSSPWFQYLLDQVLRFYPVGNRRELCNSTVCHRCDVPFGRCWTHSNLNHATHAHLGHFFDGTHTKFVAHLSGMGAMPPHHVRTNKPLFADLVTPENLQRLEGISINFLSGGDNAVWTPQSTNDSYDILRDAFPEGHYRRVFVKGYGHLDCWMGKEAFEDVFPRVRHHVEFCETFPAMVKGLSVPQD
ncbi:FAD/NAD(P)-binding domain-containing protein [Clathrospora elynae]|uniref:Cholesterol oxidase n=1 Tax=Clathrospora elynae TaxID=706981 RepID=A0A6A5S999_9PLEO|nr:FAD/NAD(P)-binding domain-containing protein [Clathrospora elynae]